GTCAQRPKSLGKHRAGNGSRSQSISHKVRRSFARWKPLVNVRDQNIHFIEKPGSFIKKPPGNLIGLHLERVLEMPESELAVR
ncbi:unnamed protein product, partial [marine sediment metagenome]